jgi:flagellin
MAFFSGNRINTNIGARNALDSLNRINARTGQVQLRLATGKRVNSVSDDAAGYTLAKKTESRYRGLQAAVNNIGEAKNILAVAESGFQAINDILLQVKEKVVQAGNASYTTDERNALNDEVVGLGAEIDRIIAETKFNGIQLLSNNGLASSDFQVGADSGDSIQFTLTASVSASGLAVTSSTIPTASTSALIGASLSSIDTAINTVSAELQEIGSLVNRLDFKEQVVSSAITNLKASRSRIIDADIAAEQLEATKLQILQQTATTQLGQANSAPQNILSLFR